MDKHNVAARKDISAFLNLVAAKLFEAAGPFALDELDVAKHESMCAAREYLKNTLSVAEAIQHVKNAVQRGAWCAYQPVADHHL